MQVTASILEDDALHDSCVRIRSIMIGDIAAEGDDKAYLYASPVPLHRPGAYTTRQIVPHLRLSIYSPNFLLQQPDFPRATTRWTKPLLISTTI
jgi:hypothetical protein